MLEYIVSIIAYLFITIILWKIIKKTGNPGFESLFIFIPIINIVILLRLAFKKWPIEEKLEKYQQEFGQLKEKSKFKDNEQLPEMCPFCNSPIPKGLKKCISCNKTYLK